VIGAHLLSTVAPALAAKAGGLTQWSALARAIAIEFGNEHLSAELVDRNRRAADACSAPHRAAVSNVPATPEAEATLDERGVVSVPT
jgi:hypothetical protein